MCPRAITYKQEHVVSIEPHVFIHRLVSNFVALVSCTYLLSFAWKYSKREIMDIDMSDTELESSVQRLMNLPRDIAGGYMKGEVNHR